MDDLEPYKLRGVGLVPGTIAEIAEMLFAGKTVSRADLMRSVKAYHLENGGKDSAANLTSQTKKALQNLVSSGKAEHVTYGQYRFASSTADSPVLSNSVASSEDDKTQVVEAFLTVESWSGDGEEFIYAYSFPAYKALAEIQGMDSWPIKIGMSRLVGLDRIRQQLGTSAPEWPVVHLAHKCTDSVKLESAIHAVLQLRGSKIEGAPGAEWFVTNPEQILEIISIVQPR
jgi:hypothetical protein